MFGCGDHCHNPVAPVSGEQNQSQGLPSSGWPQLALALIDNSVGSLAVCTLRHIWSGSTLSNHVPCYKWSSLARFCCQYGRAKLLASIAAEGGVMRSCTLGFQKPRFMRSGLSALASNWSSTLFVGIWVGGLPLPLL